MQSMSDLNASARQSYDLEGHKPPITLKHIYWLAGLLEGEGCFQAYETRNVRRQRTVTLSVRMTDQDVIEQVACLLRLHNEHIHIHTARPQKAHYKYQYICAVGGTRAIQWMMTLYPLLGQRRQEQIRRCIAVWHDMKSEFVYGRQRGRHWFCRYGHGAEEMCWKKDGSGRLHRYCRLCYRLANNRAHARYYAKHKDKINERKRLATHLRRCSRSPDLPPNAATGLQIISTSP